MSTTADVMKAIQADDIQSLKTILGAQPELATARDSNGNSPLLMSAYFGRSAMVAAILEMGLKPDLFEACAAGLADIVQRLVQENPSRVNERSHDGWTPLHLAAFFGHSEIARILLDGGAAMLTISKNNEANLPINAAAAGGRNSVVKLLVERGCPPDARSSDQGYTALHLAANSGNVELIEFLLRAGADRTLKTGSGETPYDLAVKKGHHSAAESLR
jgi:ankyrin repeat protein